MAYLVFRSVFIIVVSIGACTFSQSSFALDQKDQPKQTVESTLALPPLTPDLTDLSLNEFFKNPIGPQGLEPTEKLLSLNNQRVRVVGYMAHEDDPTPGIFMLASHPINVGEKADGMADDLPAATLYVHMPARDAEKILTYRAAPWVLTGRLQLGNQDDTNGRISYARLIMEPQDLIAAKKLDQSLQKKVQH